MTVTDLAAVVVVSGIGHARKGSTEYLQTAAADPVRPAAHHIVNAGAGVALAGRPRR